MQVRGWDVGAEAALVGTAPAKTDPRSAPAGVAPAELAKTFGDRCYVATDVPYRTQAEVDAAADGARRADRRRVRRVRGRRPGQPEAPRRHRDHDRQPRRAVRRQVLVTTSRHVYDPTTGYTTHFAVTGRQDRSLLGLASGGGRRRRASAAWSIAPGQRHPRPAAAGPGEADVPVAVRRLRQRLGAHGAARRRQGPRRSACCPRSATRCWSPSSRATSGGRTWSAGSTTASTRPSPARSTTSTAAPARSTAGRSCPAAGTGSTCSTRTAARRASRSPPATASSRSTLDAHGHRGHRAQRRHGHGRGQERRHRRRRQRQPRAHGRRRLDHRHAPGVDARRRSAR